ADIALNLRRLEKDGFVVTQRRVDSLRDLERALEAEAWDLILSDFGLPGFTGLDALKVVRARLPYIPFLMVSGTIGEESAVEALKAGVNDYILKDRLPRLGPAVRRALEDEHARAARE